MSMKPQNTMTTAAAAQTTDTKFQTMEALALPQDLYWNGKMEPISPPSNELFSTESVGIWLHDDNFAKDILPTQISIDDDMLDLKPGVILTNGDDIVVNLKLDWSPTPPKSQPASPQNHLLLDYPIGTGIQNPNPITKVDNAFDIHTLNANYFDTANLITLTPPQSPPQNGLSPASASASSSTSATSLLETIIPTVCPPNFTNVLHASPVPLANNSATPLCNVNNINAPPLPSAIEPSLQGFNFTTTPASNAWGVNDAGYVEHDKLDVDEFIKSYAKFIPDDCESQSSCSTQSPSQAESVTDEEWLPDSSYSSAGSSPIYVSGEEMQLQQSTLATTLTSVAAAAAAATTTATKKRTRPYGRGIEDRKIRKKEQNKNAATRYRQKKKLEMEVVLNEEQELNQRNDELKRTLAEREREIKYLKTLIREFYQKKK